MYKHITIYINKYLLYIIYICIHGMLYFLGFVQFSLVFVRLFVIVQVAVEMHTRALANYLKTRRECDNIFI